MNIDIINKLIIGYRFSDLCYVDLKKKIVSFCSPTLEKEVLKRFENEEIDIKEITPEFISLIMDLDHIDFTDELDGIIGKFLISTGEVEYAIRDLRNVETAKAEIQSKIENFDPEIITRARMKIVIINKVNIN